MASYQICRLCKEADNWYDFDCGYCRDCIGIMIKSGTDIWRIETEAPLSKKQLPKGIVIKKQKWREY